MTRLPGLALAVVAVVVAAAAAGPAVERPHAWQAPDDTAAVQGELLSVDLDTRTISVRAADGLRWQFLFTDDTVVNGDGAGVAGLATTRGAAVTVTYARETRGFVARVIDIAPEE